MHAQELASPSVPLLSAVVVVGRSRERAQRAVDSLSLQTIAKSIEIVVMDLAPADTPRLAPSGAAPMRYVSCPEWTMSWARAAAVQQARAPIVAYIEDHCVADPGWAAALLEAHRGPWAVVGYAFTNPDPRSYVSRAGQIAAYGLWVHPARGGRASHLPGNNASYRRDLLLSFGDRLEGVLTPDFVLQELLKHRGLPMCVEPRALVSHETFTRVRDLLGANYSYAHLLAARRRRAQRWGVGRRIAQGLVTPLLVPPLLILRMLLSLRGRRALWRPALESLPICVLTRTAAAWGEARGYLFGHPNDEKALIRWETEAERALAR
jgi:hypothetical protein